MLLDTTAQRVCFRGPEDGSERSSLGYAWLPRGEVFPFFELRAAAVDSTKHPGGFTSRECQRRVDAQLDTLAAAGVRHCVLGAFGCGAFKNPADVVARCYQTALQQRPGAFDCVVFAIFYSGYGPRDNVDKFRAAFPLGSDDRQLLASMGLS